ncbi:thioredoxin family protein [Croceivirga sp. JEA036]|uniref:thioredoxin family protein n=1 Tax=Croceivirga sp. JEA036 TaxID=2721162 RepID=UPI00143B9F35|nr:thioredoxin family protein [Croceivirga sp. JEA036]NJB37438.1 thioredoxin family protein [Croceivirga sp. JEA036]
MKFFLVPSLLFMSFMVSAQNWVTNFEEAKTLAKNQDKTILLVFSGSDWCAPCIKLDRNVWKTKEFQRFAEKHFVLYKADFPRKKKNKLPEQVLNTNKLLAEQYNVKGYFPLVVLLDANGTVLAETGYRQEKTAVYLSHLESLLK